MESAGRAGLRRGGEVAETHLAPPPGVDIDALNEWITHAGTDLGDGAIKTARPLTGGTQNISIQVERESGPRLVLRRAGLRKGEDGDATILREARVLTALAGAEVPSPRVLAICPDRDVIGGAFYLMEFVDGYNPALGLRPPHDSDPAAQHDIGLSLVDAAAHLGQVDHVAIGLAGLSSGSGWLERQVDRWLRYADSYLGLTGYVPDPTRTERLGLLQDWLNASRPSECRLGLVHGDLQFANVLVSFDTAQVAAVVDWELCTVGDPLLDLGHLLATWPRDPDLGGRLFGLAGLPSDQEVIARYQATSGTSLANLAWFRVLACFRLSIILEATFARSCAGLTKASLGTRLHRFSEILLNRGLALVTSSG